MDENETAMAGEGAGPTSVFGAGWDGRDGFDYDYDYEHEHEHDIFE